MCPRVDRASSCICNLINRLPTSTGPCMSKPLALELKVDLKVDLKRGLVDTEKIVLLFKLRFVSLFHLFFSFLIKKNVQG